MILNNSLLNVLSNRLIPRDALGAHYVRACLQYFVYRQKQEICTSCTPTCSLRGYLHTASIHMWFDYALPFPL